MSMTLTPIKLSVVPEPDSPDFMDFVSNYENKCNDFMYYSSKWPIIKSKNNILIKKRARSPGDVKRWFCREVCSNDIKYDKLRQILLLGDGDVVRTKSKKGLVANKRVEAIAPGLVDVWHTLYSKRWGGGKRDFCSLIIKKEYTDSKSAQPRKLYTPASSYANLATLTENFHNMHHHHLPTISPKPPSIPLPSISPHIRKTPSASTFPRGLVRDSEPETISLKSHPVDHVNTDSSLTSFSFEPVTGLQLPPPSQLVPFNGETIIGSKKIPQSKHHLHNELTNGLSKPLSSQMPPFNSESTNGLKKSPSSQIVPFNAEQTNGLRKLSQPHHHHHHPLNEQTNGLGNLPQSQLSIHSEPINGLKNLPQSQLSLSIEPTNGSKKPQRQKSPHSKSSGPTSSKKHSSHGTSSPTPSCGNTIVRKFQVIGVPIAHPSCPKESGYTRAFIESFTEVRELANGDVEWITVQNFSPGGWLVKSVADRAYFEEMFYDCESVLSKLIKDH
ncbi:hypothetical protein AYI68_g5540 [Smittium mucronatum]|uniref:DUF3074 domain-containing protein n=1 Tax=Smittium mucronatum TaxID=133383 RepID=A0A1R0GPK3_9FUNG|nr:hypothetical protein AYI68_g7123 [Smittium mucronatum]OLY80366.1 hypothetical protein AYI68_g5540 [Smittium mucronatum]